MPRLSTHPAPPPGAVGIGLKHQHAGEILRRMPAVGFFEIHAENYMAHGGPFFEQLQEIGHHYPISLHGVGLSLGSAAPLDAAHLERLAELSECIAPFLTSEHLAWSAFDGRYYNDLLPVPLTHEALDVVSRNLDQLQQRLGRQVLIENPSLYIDIADNELSEQDFLGQLISRTGCGLLLDINNAYISARNLDRDLERYCRELPWEAVHELHLAGHSIDDSTQLRIDDHGSPVRDEVWALYQRLARLCPEAPTLVEWDTNVPSLDTWLSEAEKAREWHGGHRLHYQEARS